MIQLTQQSSTVFQIDPWYVASNVSRQTNTKTMVVAHFLVLLGTPSVGPTGVLYCDLKVEKQLQKQVMPVKGGRVISTGMSQETYKYRSCRRNFLSYLL